MPSAVFEEIVDKGAGRPGSTEVAQGRWITRHDVRDLASVERLRVLAKELGADVLVIDDAVARRVANAEGQRVVGLAGLLLYAKQKGLIAQVRPLLDDMRAAGFFFDEARYQSLLRQGGEA